MRGRELLGALAERPFRLLWLGQTTSHVGDALIPVALAFAVIGIGGGASGLGLVLASFTLSRVVFILVGGVWADRLPRRLVMLTCDVVRAVVQALVAAALFADAMQLWMFVVASAIGGAATAFFGPASTGLVPETISDARLQQANALLNLSQSATNIFGPALSGALVALAGPGWVFAVDSASYVASTVFLVALRLGKAERPPRERFLSELADGMREAWSRGWMRAGFLLAASANLGLAPFFVLGPIIADEELGGAAAWGGILTGGAIGGLLGGVIAYRLRPKRPIMVSFLVWSLGCLPPLALLPPAPALVIAVANGLFIFGIFLGNTIYETVLQREIPPARLSRVSSFDWMVSIVFMPLGYAIVGPVAATIGREPTLLAAAALIIGSAAAGVATPSVRALRGPTPSPQPASDSGDELPDLGQPAPLP
jgi:MFS family permease